MDHMSVTFVSNSTLHTRNLLGMNIFYSMSKRGRGKKSSRINLE